MAIFQRLCYRGIIIPIYAPPDSLSPASMRFMAEMGYDDKVFAAAKNALRTSL